MIILSDNKKNQSFGETVAQTENKLIVLYLIDKMDVPLSNSEISQFILEEDIMNYFDLQQIMAELLETSYLEAIGESGSVRFILADEGVSALEFLENQIRRDIRLRINRYAAEHRKTMKKALEVTANHFYDHDNLEFIVKCGLYEDETMLMEVNLSVVTRDQAKLICQNWKENVNKLYGNIITELVTASRKEDGER